jgi:tetratricopeptide (TPR) repeat protein
MSRLRGRSQNRESQETCPTGAGAAFQRKHFGAAKARPRLIGLLLAFITLLAYLPAARDSFLDFDDDLYVTNNHIVQNGLTWAGIKWAFTTLCTSYWHPLTWLSHMLDCELFGLNAGAQHYVNVLFHTANVVLLLLLLFRLTGALWPSAFVAALFAWHPLHVESVAWISERKDVLSTFFALLTLLAYTRYAQCVTRGVCQVTQTNSTLSPVTRLPAEALAKAGHPSRFYWLALFFFTLGLMSKPMLVTLPFVMLLLDYWPLQRFPPSAFRLPLFLRLALEKWPFFLLTAISCVVTFLAQRNDGFVPTLRQYPLDLRLGNTLLSYALYLGKAVWPAKLSINYPLQNQLPWAEVAAAAIFLMVITWLAWRARQRCPYLLIGWLWFLGMLVPVIGLVQECDQALADRFTYVPLVGVFIAVTFGIKDLIARFQIGVVPTAAAAGLVLGSCLVLTERQLSYWRNDETLSSHAIAVTKNNCLAHNNLGVALARQGRQAEAIANFQEAIRINPYWVSAHNNLAGSLDDTGKPEEALVEYRQAMQLDLMQLNSNQSVAHGNIGRVLAELGRFDEAMGQLKEAARLDPNYPWAHFDMGQLLLKQGRDAEAIDQFREVLRLDPDNFQILAYVAHVLAADENPGIRNGQTALIYAAKANVLSGGIQPLVLDALGMACAETGRFDDAQEAVERAINIATAVGGMKQNVTSMQQRLRLYQNHQPWRESFLYTNTPSRNSQKS